MKPKIGCDLDDVLMPFTEHFIPLANDFFGTSYSPNHLLTYDPVTLFGTSEPEFRQVVYEFMNKKAPDIQPIPDAKKHILRLAKTFDIHIVTARNSAYTQHTLTWLNDHFKDVFKGVHFCNFFAVDGHNNEHPMTKSDILLKYGMEALIDDNVDNINDVNAAGLTGILYGNYPWHTFAKSGTILAPTWPEVSKQLKSITLEYNWSN